MITDRVSGQVDDSVTLTCIGATDGREWDLNGDGQNDEVGDVNGIVSVELSGERIFRPFVKGFTGDFLFGTAGVSILITDGNERPQATAFANPSRGIAPLDVWFTGSAIDVDGQIIMYAWDFDGDGFFEYEHSSNPNPPSPHTFTEDGTYYSVFKVWDNDGATDTETVTVVVEPNIQPPANLTASKGLSRFWIKVEWDFVDNVDYYDIYHSREQFSGYSYIGQSVGDFYWDIDPVPDPGIWWYKAKSRRNDGAESDFSNEDYGFIETNEPPIASLSAIPLSGETPLTVDFDASDSYDPDGNITDYEWDLDGDGIYNEAGEEASRRGETTAEWTYTSGGYHYPKIRVTDDEGTTDTDNEVINVTSPPEPQWHTKSLVVLVNYSGHPSLASVQGRPAITYYDWSGGDLKYLLADGNLGESWASPISVDTLGATGKYNWLEVVNGRPAISYKSEFGAGDSELRFIRASDSLGQQWDESAIIIDDISDSGDWTCLQVINGNPAVIYDRGGNLYYVRSDDINGAEWSDTPFELVSGGVHEKQAKLLTVNGKPSISTVIGIADQSLGFKMATDSTGSDWPTGYIVDDASYSGYDSSLIAANGRPAICYPRDGLCYKRALASDGSEWPTNPYHIDQTHDVGATAMVLDDGLPVIAYIYSGSYEGLMFVSAEDSSGTSWGAPVSVDEIAQAYNVGRAVDMNIINGNPSIVYFADLGPTQIELRFAIFH